MANGNGASVGFEADLWKAADALRGSMDAAEYKHVVLGLLFLKYISDAFEEQRSVLETQTNEGADPEDPDEYRAAGVFWVPKDARWSVLKAAAKQPTIGQIVDDAMIAIERDNPSLRNVLPKDYARQGLDKTRLGQLVDMVSNIAVGDRASRSKDVLGRTYEYFLSQFASAEGKKGGEFYTPQCVVRLLVEMLAPYKGRVYDPCCGSGGMFVQSEKFIEEHGGRVGDIAVYGQESNYTTWRLAKMNLAIRGIDANIAHGDTFHRDGHPDLKADYILANPPFNDSDWNGQLLKSDKRWLFGVPPTGNANYAWIQHFVSHLAPHGTAGFVLANGSMSSMQSGEGEIRRLMVEADLVECMVALPGQLFYSTPIPVCLWFLSRKKTSVASGRRRGEILFIDARGLGTMIDRTHRELGSNDLSLIAKTYHDWGQGSPDDYADVPGFCRTVTIDAIRAQGFDLTPSRYVGSLVDEVCPESLRAQVMTASSRVRVTSDRALNLERARRTAAEEIQVTLSGLQARIASAAPLGTLGQLATSVREMVYPERMPDEEFELYSIPDFDATGMPSVVPGAEILSGKLRVSGSALLVSKLNPNTPRVWPVAADHPRAVCSTEFVVLQAQSEEILDYLYLWLQSPPFREHLCAHATGSTGSRQRVKVHDVLAAPIPDLPAEDIELMSTIMRPFRAKAMVARAEQRAADELVERLSRLLALPMTE